MTAAVRLQLQLVRLQQVDSIAHIQAFEIRQLDFAVRHSLQHRQLLRLLFILLSYGIHLLERRQAFACCGLNALGNQYLLQRIAEDRGADLRAVEGSLRRIQHNQHCIARFIRRHKAYEGSNVLTGRITAAGCQLLGCTCFAGNTVALNRSSLATAIAYYLFPSSHASGVQPAR